MGGWEVPDRAHRPPQKPPPDANGHRISPPARPGRQIHHLHGTSLPCLANEATAPDQVLPTQRQGSLSPAATILGAPSLPDSCLRRRRGREREEAFEERSRRRAHAGGGERADEQLMLTWAQWAARRRQGGGGFNHHDDDDGSSTTWGGGKRRGRCYNCGVRGHFRRDCRSQKKAEEEKALLADADDQPGLY
ncbi:hypothetical protein D1007_34788 [Hordeum vulgare]|nr:hypothetical protein D1007_34788 [Hordeum vulgare]